MAIGPVVKSKKPRAWYVALDASGRGVGSGPSVGELKRELEKRGMVGLEIWKFRPASIAELPRRKDV